jgi:hypothetical protein
MSTQHTAIMAAMAALLVFPGCKDTLEGESLGLLDLAVYKAASTDPASDPYSNVSFVRLAVTDDNGKMLTDKFVRFEEAAQAALDAIPFGSGLKITLEGWSQNDSGLIGQLISRGRSLPFTVFEDSAFQEVPIMMSRVNAFGMTSQQTQNGSVATRLNRGRIGHSVSLLPNGTVLIMGGATSTVAGDYTQPSDLSAVHRSVEVYDPRTGIWTEFADGLATARAFHSTTTLSDGRIAVAGGITDTAGTTLNSVELFDPSSGGNFILDATVTLNASRAGHTASLVEGGDHIVFAGGFTTVSGTRAALNTVEVVCITGAACQSSGQGVIYTGVLAEARAFHTATRVKVGPNKSEAVVLIGGEGDEGTRDSAETFILNPAAVSEHRPIMGGGGRTRHTATLIPSQGFIHVVGGFSDKNHAQGIQQIDSYQLTQEVFQTSQEFYSLHARGGHSAVAMPGNAILLFGGFHGGETLASAEVIFEYFDEASNQTFIDRGGVSPMSMGRGGSLGVLLPNDTVLVVGGQGPGGQPNTVGEFFNPL